MQASSSQQTTTMNGPFLSISDWSRILTDVVSPEMKKDYRRRNKRYPSDWQAKCRFEYRGDMTIRDVTILEVSIEGMSLRSSYEMQSDTTVYFEITPNEIPVHLKGRVIHSTETVGGFKVGVHLIFA